MPASSLRWDETLSGAAAGVVGTAIGHPLDTVKVRMQTSANYRGALHCAKHIWRTEGWRALYQGMAAPLVSLTLLNTMSFALYGGFSRAITRATGAGAGASAGAGADAGAVVGPASPTASVTIAAAAPAAARVPWWHSALAGGCTGASISVVSTPFDVVKLNAQMQRRQALSAAALGTGAAAATAAATSGVSAVSAAPAPAAVGSWPMLQRLVRAHGYGVLFRGYGINTVREFVFGAAYFGVYSAAKREFTAAFTAAALSAGASLSAAAPAAAAPPSAAAAASTAPAAAVSPVVSTASLESGARAVAVVCAGSASGMTGWLLSFPLDIAKTRLQTDLNTRTSAWQALRAHTRDFGGWSGLYRGLSPTLARASIVSAVRFSAYEAAMALLGVDVNARTI